MQQKEKKEQSNDSVWIVIAGYNEEKRIEAVISDLKKNGYHNVVVVDDGSKDATGAVAVDAGATVLRHVMNRGQGAALKTGIDFAVKNDAEIIVTFDADGQHHSKKILWIFCVYFWVHYSVILYNSTTKFPSLSKY